MFKIGDKVRVDAIFTPDMRERVIKVVGMYSSVLILDVGSGLGHDGRPHEKYIKDYKNENRYWFVEGRHVELVERAKHDKLKIKDLIEKIT